MLTTIFWWPPVTSQLLPADLVFRNVVTQLADWVFALALVAIVVFWERRPLSSLGFKPLTLTNFSAGMGMGGFFMIGVALWFYGILPFFPGFGKETMDTGADASELPRHFFYWYAPFALVTASFCEEVIYRGYAMERLLSIAGRPWVAVLVSHGAFVLYHVKDGWSSVLMLSVFALLFPLYYIRYRDLTMMIVAHAFIDLMAVIGYYLGIGPK